MTDLIFSIIIPVYNAETTIRRCLDSFTNQRFSDYEILLINDGSTDNSDAICREYADVNSKICYLSKENGGVSSARNLGLEQAKGEYALFVDSDDYVSEDYFDVIDVRGKDEMSEQEARYTKVKVGKTRLFNAEALDTAEKPVFIVEGEIDAMSIVEAGGEAVGLGSASNVRLLLERLAEKKPAQPLILALDNDERGRKASCELEDGLRAAGLPYFVYNPCGDCKDANEALQMAPESFLRRVGDGERLPEIERITYLQTSAQGHLQAFVDGIAESVNTPCLPTGFDALDRALDGGLYEGLYIVGAISSL